MFVEAFGLRCDPFMDTADPAFYYETLACANARRRLAQCLTSGRGLAVIVGPIGVGKTTLCSAVQQDVLGDPRVRAGLILDPSFSDEREFLQAAAAALEIDAAMGDGIRAVKEHIKRTLLASVARDVQYVLFIDEAQLLHDALFETLRALLNFQIDDRKLLALALSGQPELAGKLAHHPAFADRISMWLDMRPLEQGEASALLDHRLRCAGFAGERSPFEPEAATLAWRSSAGLPRRLTAIAREAMEVAAERRARSVDAGDVRAALLRLPPQAVGTQEPGMARVRAVKRTWPWSWFAP
jgi:general secretion pathway protein A